MTNLENEMRELKRSQNTKERDPPKEKANLCELQEVKVIREAPLSDKPSTAAKNHQLHTTPGKENKDNANKNNYGVDLDDSQLN